MYVCAYCFVFGFDFYIVNMLSMFWYHGLPQYIYNGFADLCLDEWMKAIILALSATTQTL